MGSSSKRKPSRKKSSKLSAKALKMKKRRTKSKKLGRRHDSSTDDPMSSHSISSPGNHSYSSNSDDNSMSSTSISTSSSEGTCRKRRRTNVSRAQSNRKKTRKSARRRSSSRKSSVDLPCTKKRKRSKKKSDSKLRKKSQRKKPRRDVSVSSASSDTHSCSTCKGGSDSESEDRGRVRIRSRSKENKKDRRDLRKVKHGNKRSRSHSSYSRSRDQSCSVSYSEEKLLTESNTRRLKSVITFPEQPSEEEENNCEKDLQKEEIVYDHDDYPSSSSGGGSKKESTPRSPVEFDGQKWTENVKSISDHGDDEPAESGNDAREPCIHDPFMNDFETNNSLKESRKDTLLQGAGSGGDDLEAILRQKALQNLKKFRGGMKNSVKPTDNDKNQDDGDINPSSTSKAEFVPGRLPEQAPSTEVESEVSGGGYTAKVSGITKQNSNNPHDGLALSWNPEEEDHTNRHLVAGSSVTRNTSFRGRSSGIDSSLNQTPTSVASPDKNLIETDKSESEIKITELVSPNSSINQGTTSSAAIAEPASCGASGQQSSNNQLNEAKNSSQYQQKTMSVMRGGEMVQVNYKVYIPQRAPAFARRQLKR